MFFGTTPNIVAQFVTTEFTRLAPPRVWVLFAGNFVVEQLAAAHAPSAEIHSTDVSLYSRAVGFGLTGRAFAAALKPDIAALFPAFAAEDPLTRAAAALFFSDIGKALAKRQVRYYDNIYREALANQNAYRDKLVTKLTALAAAVKMTFYGCDACALIDRIQAGDVVFYDPPVALGDYEKMFKPLEDCFDFAPEPHTVIDDAVKQAHLRLFAERGAKVFYRTNAPIPPPENYTEVFRYKYGNGFYCVYTNAPEKRFVGGYIAVREKPLALPIVSATDIFTADSKIEVVNVQPLISNHYRLMWVKKAELTKGGFCFLIFVDGKLIGLLQLESASRGKYADKNEGLIALFSDPAAPSSRYPKLSKLVIMLCASEEMLKLFNDLAMWEHSGLTTRVFTNNAVSMKYRGLFDLVSREEVKDGDFKYKLVYQKRGGMFPSFRAAFQTWLKKYGNDTTD